MKTVKIVLFIILCLCTAQKGIAQKGQWLRVIHANSFDNLVPQYVYTDNKGIIYVMTNLFLDGIFGKDTIKSGGHRNLIISRYDSLGHTLPLINVPLNGWDFSANALTTDKAGNIYIAGGWYDVNSSRSIILIKCDSAGKILWTRSVGGSVRGEGITLDKNENIYLSGYINDFFSMDNKSLKNTGSAWNSFTLKLRPDSNLKWVEFFYGDNIAHMHGDMIGNNGSLYVAGHFTGTGNIDGYSFMQNGVPGLLFNFDTANGKVRFISADTVPAFGEKYYPYQDRFGTIYASSYGGFYISKFNEKGQRLSYDDSMLNTPNYLMAAGVNRNGEVLEAYYDTTSRKISFLLTDASGNHFWNIPSPLSGSYNINRIVPDPTGQFYIYGSWFTKIGLGTDTFFKALSSSGQFVARITGSVLTGMQKAEVPAANTIELYPNPNNGNFTLGFTESPAGMQQLDVFNVLGQNVYSSKTAGDKQSLSIQLKGLTPGVYTLQLQFEKGISSKSFCVY